MRVALYARVSTEGQQARGTIGSQLAVLRDRVGAEGDEVAADHQFVKPLRRPHRRGLSGALVDVDLPTAVEVWGVTGRFTN
jgi:DNA invertase Pin-like site-specific DNA recombinase